MKEARRRREDATVGVEKNGEAQPNDPVFVGPVAGAAILKGNDVARDRRRADERFKPLRLKTFELFRLF